MAENNKLSEMDILVRQDGCDERPEDMELPDEWKSDDADNDEDMMEDVVDGSQMHGDGLHGLQQNLGNIDLQDDFADTGLTREQALEALRKEFGENQANKEY